MVYTVNMAKYTIHGFDGMGQTSTSNWPSIDLPYKNKLDEAICTNAQKGAIIQQDEAYTPLLPSHSFKQQNKMKSLQSLGPMVLLMEEILHQLIGKLPNYPQGFLIPGGTGFLPSTV